jgi:hypothetical protein
MHYGGTEEEAEDDGASELPAHEGNERDGGRPGMPQFAAGFARGERSAGEGVSWKMRAESGRRMRLDPFVECA